MAAKSGAKSIALNLKKLKKKKKKNWRKSNKNNEFFPNDASVKKEIKELKIIKLKDSVKLQNILFVKD